MESLFCMISILHQSWLLPLEGCKCLFTTKILNLSKKMNRRNQFEPILEKEERLGRLH